MSKQVIDSYLNILRAIYAHEGLVSLRNNDCTFQGVNIQQNPTSTFAHANWNREKNLSDLIVLTEDIMFFTGQLYMHVDLINNPTTEVDTATWPGEAVALYNQNLYDRRYCTFVSVCFEKVYNYWDRIGDLIHSFFPNLIPDIRQVDFPKIIDRLNNIGETDVDFIWLRDFKINEWMQLNNYRRDIVHYYQFESNYRHDFLSGPPTNQTRMAEIFADKIRYPEYFNSHLRLACEGCTRTYAFLFRVLARP